MADQPQVVQIPVKRRDVNLTIQDIMTPLTTFAERHAASPALAAAPEALQQANELANLARQILTIAGRLNAVAPHLLAPTPPQAPPQAPSGDKTS